MIDRGQPWGTYQVSGRVARVQILDPVTAFEIEPVVVRVLGPAAALVVADPGSVIAALGHGLIGSLGEVSAQIEARAASLVGALVRATEQPSRLLEVYARAVLGSVEFDGARIRSWADLGRAELSPGARWALLGLQLRQTFAPVWSRSPYPSSSRAAIAGPRPPEQPLAAQWAAQLAADGYASSTVEILTTWTPAQLLDTADMAIHAAAVLRAQREAASHASP